MIHLHERELKRDPFARTTVVRRPDTAGQGARECACCGAIRRSAGGRPLLAWNYGTRHDGGRTEWSRSPFCGRDCSRTFHGN